MDSRIQTFTSIVDPLNLMPEDVRIEDIAHSLSLQCRYTGHTTGLYSVGQHCLECVLVAASLGATVHEQLEVLLHDASETYLTDLASPIKNTGNPLGAAYRALEHDLTVVINERFGIPYPPSPIVKEVDLTLLVTEVRDMVPNNDEEAELELWDRWLQTVPPLERVLKVLPPDFVESRFLMRFTELGGK